MTNEPKTPSKRWSIVGIVAIGLAAFTSVMSFVNAFLSDQPVLWLCVAFVFTSATVFALLLWTKRS